jgi:hypothetical protein
MKTLQNLIVLCLIATTFACGDKDDGCEGQKDIYHYLSQDAKSKIPYTGIDTLRFVSNTGDTAICIGQGKKVTYDSQFNQGGTCNWYEQYEVNTMLFVDDIPQNNIEIKLSQKIGALYFNFKTYTYYIDPVFIGDSRLHSFRSEYNIENKTYYNVHLLESKTSNNNILVFSSVYGIIQIINGSNEIWNRL